MNKKKIIVSLLIWISITAMLFFSYFKPSSLDIEVFQKFESFDSYEKISINPDAYRVSLQGVEVGYMAFGIN